MNQLQRDMEQVRKNIAEHERAEKARIDRLVREASKSTDAFVAEQERLAQQAEREREAAMAAREAKIEADQRDDAERRYLAAGGRPADFEQWYVGERMRQVTERIAQEQAAAREAYRARF